MFGGNEWMVLVLFLAVVAAVVYGVYVLIRKAVQSGVERGHREP